MVFNFIKLHENVVFKVYGIIFKVVRKFSINFENFFQLSIWINIVKVTQFPDS